MYVIRCFKDLRPPSIIHTDFASSTALRFSFNSVFRFFIPDDSSLNCDMPFLITVQNKNCLEFLKSHHKSIIFISISFCACSCSCSKIHKWVWLTFNFDNLVKNSTCIPTILVTCILCPLSSIIKSIYDHFDCFLPLVLIC